MNRPMHFAVDYSGLTLCGKSTTRVRTTYRDVHWVNPILAGGKRCAECTKLKARMLTEEPR